VRIELKGVGKRFGKVEALRQVDWLVPEGRRVALIGPNGSGKSTLTRVVMGLVGADGDVKVGGHAPDRERAALMQRLAYVPQIAPQLRAPVGEIARAVTDVRGLAKDAIAGAAARLGLDLAAIAGQAFRNLSGGMKQKLLIALALASRADLYILDEPTASLDAATRERFFELFDEVAGSATLVLCSHRLDEIRRLVSHVVALDEGRVVYDGPADAYLESRAAPVVDFARRVA
jgi:ABC-2 type transport system ATP-binding protein